MNDLERDAARYRWLREQHNNQDGQWFVYGVLKDIDLEIDGAMAMVPYSQHGLQNDQREAAPASRAEPATSSEQHEGGQAGLPTFTRASVGYAPEPPYSFPEGVRLSPAERFTVKILDAYAEHWATNLDGLTVQDWLLECGLLTRYKVLTAADIEALAGVGHDMSDFDPGDTYYAYNDEAERIRNLELLSVPVEGRKA